MPSIERKSIDRLGGGDRLFVDAGILARAGRQVDEKLIRLLGTHKAAVVTVINPTYEERARIKATGMDENKFILEVIGARGTAVDRFRSRLVEQLRSVYVPFSELDRGFCARGRKKQITADILLSPEPGPLYQGDIDAGSQTILTPAVLQNLKTDLDRLYEYIEGIIPSKEDGGKVNEKKLPTGLHSIRLHSIFNSGRLQSVGDALVWHAVDSALLFMLSMAQINRNRIKSGGKLSTTRFNPEKPSFQKDIYYYDRDLIIQAGLGILIHALGFCHVTVHEVMSTKPVLTGGSKRELEIIKILRRNYNVVKNLVRNREDISPISRMMITGQYDYPDGTGYPPIDRNNFLHEFIRLFHIIDTWDELTNPVLGKTAFSRHKALMHIEESSGTYSYRRDTKVYSPRFDENLLNNLKEILRPYSQGEKVYISPPEDEGTHVYVGRVFSYLGSPIPTVSILKDERTGKRFPFGKVILNIPQGTIYVRRSGKDPSTTKNPWLTRLVIHEAPTTNTDITGTYEYLYGAVRNQPKRR